MTAVKSEEKVIDTSSKTLSKGRGRLLLKWSVDSPAEFSSFLFLLYFFKLMNGIINAVSNETSSKV